MAEVSPTRRPTPLQWLWLLFFLLYLPCLWKPPHIDEESYLFIASEVAHSVLRPYDWWRPWQPGGDPAAGSFIFAHPPFLLWTLAGEGALTSSVPWLRVLQLPWVMLWVLATFLLARQLTRQVVLTTLFFGVAPAVLLCLHQSLMIDLSAWALAFAGWALAREALILPRPSRLNLWAGLCLGAAALTKYPTLLIWIPLLGMAPRTQDPGRWRMIPLIGLGIPLLWQLYTWAVYGTPHLIYVLQHAGEITRAPLSSRLFGTLAQLGLTVVAPPLLWGALPRRWFLWGGVGALALMGLLHWAGDVLSPTGLVGLVWALVEGSSAGLPSSLSGRLLLGVGWAGGLVLVRAALYHGLRGETLDKGLARAFLLTVGGVVLSHNFIGGRYLVLPGLLATLLLCRLSERNQGVGRWRRAGGWSVALSMALALAVAWADLRWARVYPGLVAQVDIYVQEQQPEGKGPFDAMGRPSQVSETWWYTGEWGLRYQADQRGWTNLLLGKPKVGDWIVTSQYSAPGVLPAGVVLAWTLPAPSSLLKTQAPAAGIGFYSEVFGLLPYGFAPGPLDVLEIYRVTGDHSTP